jgi:hypothetical protein
MVNKIVNIILIGVALAIIAIGVLSILPTYIPGNAEDVRPEFERRREQWKAVDIEHYRMIVWAGGFGSPILFCAPAIVEVETGKAIDIQLGPYRIDLTQIPEASQNCLSNYTYRDIYSHMTVDHLFAIVARMLDDPDYFNVTFTLAYDDTYGYPTRINLSSPNTGHMPQYSIDDFEVLRD